VYRLCLDSCINPCLRWWIDRLMNDESMLTCIWKCVCGKAEFEVRNPRAPPTTDWVLERMLEKLIVAHLLANSPSYVARSFVDVFPRTSYWTLSAARWIHCILVYFSKILVNVILPLASHLSAVSSLQVFGETLALIPFIHNFYIDIYFTLPLLVIPQ